MPRNLAARPGTCHLLPKAHNARATQQENVRVSGVEHVIDAVLLLSIVVPIYLGFALLALAQRRFWRLIRTARMSAVAPTSAPVGLLRTAAAGLLASSLPLALWRETGEAGFGFLLWAVLLSTGVLGVVATLTWRPHWLRPLANIAAAISRVWFSPNSKFRRQIL